MPNFKKLYFKLFNKVSDTVDDLQEVQCEVEEEIINDDTYVDDKQEYHHTHTEHQNPQ